MLPNRQDLGSTGGWLSGCAIQEAVKAGDIVISPYSGGQVNPNSYNYSLSPQIRRLSNDVVDAYAVDEYETLTIPDEGLILEPGECYLGSTSEVFGSHMYAALITGRSSVGRKFITNHVTAGHGGSAGLGNRPRGYEGSHVPLFKANGILSIWLCGRPAIPDRHAGTRVC